MRVESPIGYGEQIRVRCYYPGCARFEMFPDIIPFTGESVGRPSQLLSLVLGNDAEVYEPDISELLDNEIIVVPDTLEVELPADD